MTLQEQLRKLTTGGPGVTHIASETLFEDCAQKLDDDWKDSQALMKLLADEKHKVAALEARCRELEANHRRIRHTVDCHVPIGEIRDVLLEMVDQCLPAETKSEPTRCIRGTPGCSYGDSNHAICMAILTENRTVKP